MPFVSGPYLIIAGTGSIPGKDTGAHVDSASENHSPTRIETCTRVRGDQPKSEIVPENGTGLALRAPVLAGASQVIELSRFPNRTIGARLFAEALCALYPRPTNGIWLAMTVMDSTLASSGRLA